MKGQGSVGGQCVLPWTRRCTEVVLGRLLVCTAHTYWPSSVMSTFWILMVNSSWFRVTRLTLGSTDHLSSPAYSMLDRLSHAVCVTTSPCAHLWRDMETNTHFRLSRRIRALDKYFKCVFGRECTVSDRAENFKETRFWYVSYLLYRTSGSFIIHCTFVSDFLLSGRAGRSSSWLWNLQRRGTNQWQQLVLCYRLQTAADGQLIYLCSCYE